MYRCSIHKMLIEKLQDYNSFFTTHRYPPYLKFRQRQRIFIQFLTAMWRIYKHWHETFWNSDKRHGSPQPPGRVSVWLRSRAGFFEAQDQNSLLFALAIYCACERYFTLRPGIWARWFHALFCLVKFNVFIGSWVVHWF